MGCPPSCFWPPGRKAFLDRRVDSSPTPPAADCFIHQFLTIAVVLDAKQVNDVSEADRVTLPVEFTQ